MEFLKSFKACYSYVLWCFLTNSHIFLAENNNRVEFNFGNVRIWTNNLTYPNNSGVNGELSDVNKLHAQPFFDELFSNPNNFFFKVCE